MKVEAHKPEQEVCMNYTQLEQSFLDSLICSAAELATAIGDPSAGFIQRACVCAVNPQRLCATQRSQPQHTHTHTPIASVGRNKQEIEISSTLPQAPLLTPSLAFTDPQARPEHQHHILYTAWIQRSEPENTAQLFCECSKCCYSVESALDYNR